MEPWLIFVLLAALFAAVGIYKSKRRTPSPTSKGLLSLTPQVVQKDARPTSKPALPAVWDEALVSRQLTQFKSHPDVIASYIDALKQRFILKVEDGTAKHRTNFLRTHIEELKLGKEYRMLLQDLAAMETEQENRLLKLKLEQQELQSRQAQGKALDGLRLKKEQLAVEVEIASLEAQKAAFKNPDRVENLTPEQRRAKEKKEVEVRLAELKAEKALVLKISDEGERILRANAIDDAIQREMARWAKLL